MFADELTKMEAKWKEQLKINENLKLQLAAEEDRYKVRGPPSFRPSQPHDQQQLWSLKKVNATRTGVIIKQ